MGDDVRDQQAHDIFSIDASSSVPPFKQVHNAVVAAIASRELVPGQKLPTIRSLATRLDLAVNTVASAYKSLEAAGVVEGRGRAGTFVSLAPATNGAAGSASGTGAGSAESADPITASARAVLLEAAERMRALGVDDAVARRLFAEALAARS